MVELVMINIVTQQCTFHNWKHFDFIIIHQMYHIHKGFCENNWNMISLNVTPHPSTDPLLCVKNLSELKLSNIKDLNPTLILLIPFPGLQRTMTLEYLCVNILYHSLQLIKVLPEESWLECHGLGVVLALNGISRWGELNAEFNIQSPFPSNSSEPRWRPCCSDSGSGQQWAWYRNHGAAV